MNPKTKEWKDGIFSVIMRDMNKNNPPYKPSHAYKWVILDGDIDPMWIESLNTVMDDNKVLTLVSQERIPMTPPMRLVLEISHLKNATPATVSRGGVLFVNDNDVGWKPYFDSWISKYKKDDPFAESVFNLALTHYQLGNEQFMDDMRRKSHITPICDMQCIQSLTTIIDRLYDNLKQDKVNYDHLKKLREENNEEKIKEIYDAFFVFASMWALGGALDEDKFSFSGQWKSASKMVKFPDETGRLVFDYFFDVIEGKWVNWYTQVPKHDTSYDGLFCNLIVPTAQTVSQKYLLDMHVASKKGMLYVGSAGTAKTTIIKDYFNSIDKDKILTQNMNFNMYTGSKEVQTVVESQVQKITQKCYGPQPGKTLIYFFDDLNMPYLDVYGTQSPICLIR